MVRSRSDAPSSHGFDFVRWRRLYCPDARLLGGCRKRPQEAKHDTWTKTRDVREPETNASENAGAATGGAVSLGRKGTNADKRRTKSKNEIERTPNCPLIMHDKFVIASYSDFYFLLRILLESEPIEQHVLMTDGVGVIWANQAPRGALFLTQMYAKLTKWRPRA